MRPDAPGAGSMVLPPGMWMKPSAVLLPARSNCCTASRHPVCGRGEGAVEVDDWAHPASVSAMSSRAALVTSSGTRRKSVGFNWFAAGAGRDMTKSEPNWVTCRPRSASNRSARANLGAPGRADEAPVAVRNANHHQCDNENPADYVEDSGHELDEAQHRAEHVEDEIRAHEGAAGASIIAHEQLKASVGDERGSEEGDQQLTRLVARRDAEDGERESRKHHEDHAEHDRDRPVRDEKGLRLHVICPPLRE